MKCWEFLGIEPTEDKQAIKIAYMDKLEFYHPEEDPEGFKKLREAYETALQEANSLNVEEEKDETPTGIWLEKVKEVYQCFSKRINTAYWEELLEDEVCYQLDMAEEANYKLLNFLEDNYRMPQAVWALLYDKFCWEEKKEELLKEFPEGFINFIFDESTYDYNNAIIKYELFEGFDDADYDEWFRKYFDIRRALNDGNLEEAEKIFEEVKELEIYHPEMECLKIRYLVISKKFDEAREIVNDLLEKYPDNPSYIYNAGQIELFSENIGPAKEYYKKALELNPEHIGATEGMGECYFIEENYAEAEDYYIKASNAYPYDDYISSRIYDIQTKLVEQYMEKIENNSEEIDNKFLFKAAWTAFEVRNYEKAKEIFDKIEPQEKDFAQYYDLKGRVYSELGEYETAIESFEKMFEISPDDEKFKLYTQRQMGIQYYNMKNYEKALEYYNEALEIEKNDVDLYNRKAVTLFVLGRFEESVQACDLGLKLDFNIAHLHINKAKALYELGKYGVAIDECQITNNIYPYFKDAYLIQLKIFGEVGEFQRALEIVNQIDEIQLEYWELEQYKGKVYNSVGDYEKSKEAYRKALELDGVEEDKVLYDLAQVLNNNGEYEEALEQIDESIRINLEPYKYMLKGLIHKNLGQKQQAIRSYNYCIRKDYNPDYAENNKGRIFEDDGDYTNALKCYKKALKINPNHPSVNNNIGEVLEKIGREGEALEYYNRQIEIEPDAYYFVNRAWCNNSLDNDDEAIEDFKSALKYEPDNVYAHNGLGVLYKKLKRFEEAIEEFKKVEELDNAQRFSYLYRDMGQCYVGIKDNEKAEEIYTLGIEKFPYNESIYLSRGLLYLNTKVYEQAMEDFKKVLKLNPRNEYAYNNIGVVYDEQKDYENAIKYYKKALEIEPEHDRANKNIAEIYMNEIKDYNLAIKYYKRQIEIEKELDYSENPYLHRMIAQAYYKLKKYLKAKEYASLALKIYNTKEKDACTYRYMACCYRYMKMIEKAREYYNKAIELASSCEKCEKKECHEAYCEIGEIYEEFGNFEKALEYYEIASRIDSESDEYKEDIIRVRGKISEK